MKKTIKLIEGIKLVSLINTFVLAALGIGFLIVGFTTYGKDINSRTYLPLIEYILLGSAALLVSFGTLYIYILSCKSFRELVIKFEKEYQEDLLISENDIKAQLRVGDIVSTTEELSDNSGLTIPVGVIGKVVDCSHPDFPKIEFAYKTNGRPIIIRFPRSKLDKKDF